MRAGSQPGCALLGLPLAFGVSGHSSLQLCQLGAVTLLSCVVGGAQHCSPLPLSPAVGRALLWTSPPCHSWCYMTLLLLRILLKAWPGFRRNLGSG